MRDAKASPGGSAEPLMGSTFGLGRSRGLFGRAFAIRRASGDADGSSAPSVGHLLVLGVLVLVLFVTLTGTASAARTYTSQLTEGGGATPYPFANPVGLTTDASNNVWVTDTGSGAVDKFDFSGSFEHQGSGFFSYGGEYIESAAFSQAAGEVFVSDSGEAGLRGVNTADASSSGVHLEPLGATECCYLRVAADNSAGATGGDLYTFTSEGKILRTDGSGSPDDFTAGSSAGSNELSGADTPAGSFAGPGERSGGGIAVDSAGRLYVADGSHHAVDVFEPSGEFLEAITETESGPLGTLNAVAVDPTNGNILVAENTAVQEFSASGEFLATISEANGAPFGKIQGLAADSTGKLYVADGGTGAVDVFVHATGVSLPTVTIDPVSSISETSAHVSGSVNPEGSATSCQFRYVTNDDFEQSGFSGASSAPCAESPGSGTSAQPVEAELTNLQALITYRVQLIAQNEGGYVESESIAFTTLSKPQVQTLSTHGPVASASARILGSVDPRGLEVTECEFEYGPNIHYGQSAPCLGGANPPNAAAVPILGEETLVVAANLTGLQANTTYHYRLVATNLSGTVEGVDQTVATHLNPPPPSSPASCPNEAVRKEQEATYLPDCRAYEQVSQPKKGSQVVSPSDVEPSIDGDHVLYTVDGGLSNSSGGVPRMLATRTAAGWESKSILPPRSQMFGSQYSTLATTPNLSGEIAMAWDGFGPGAPTGTLLRLADNGDQSPLNTFPRSGMPSVVISDDLAHVFLQPANELGGPMLAEDEIYDFGSGSPKLISRMPGTNQAPSCGIYRFAGTTFTKVPASQHFAAEDGLRVFFESRGDGAPDCEGPVQLFVRDLTTGTTTPISSPPLPGDPNNGVDPEAGFLQAAADGSWVIFRTATSLAPGDDSDGNSSDMDIYRYNTDSGVNVCLTCSVPNAEVATSYAGAKYPEYPNAAVAEDGSHVYFLSNKQFAGAPSPGDGFNLNLYVWHRGTIDFVAKTDFESGPSPSPSGAGGEVTPDGNSLILSSANPGLNVLTGTENSGRAQFYRYDDRDRSVVCLTCPGSGAASTGVESILTRNALPVTPAVQAVTNDGRKVFFSTAESLISADTNGPCNGFGSERGCVDLYEWNEGTLSLISDGAVQHAQPPSFISVGTDGRDVFFGDAEKLTADAQDSTSKIYVARIDGGFSAPLPPPPPCSEDSCQGIVSQAAGTASAASAAFNGPGSQPAGRHRRATHHKKHKHKKRHRRHTSRRHG